MAAPVGVTVRGYSRCPEYSEMIPSDTFELGRSVTNRRRTDAVQARPRRFGHDLSGAPDSVSVVMEGRVTIACAGLAKVHSDRYSHSRSDANAGLVNEKLLLRMSDWMG